MNLNKLNSNLTIFVLLSVLTGFLSGILAVDSRGIYENLILPPFAFEGFVFSIVWTVLYILIGISFSLIYENRFDYNIKKALVLFGLQMFCNFIWSIIFFRFENFLLALVDIIILDILVFLTIREFEKISELSAMLLMPYFAFILYATYLNLGIYLIN